MLNGGNETVQSPAGQIDGTNIARFLYTGPVTGLHASFDRTKYVTLTLEGEPRRCPGEPMLPRRLLLPRLTRLRTRRV